MARIRCLVLVACVLFAGCATTGAGRSGKGVYHTVAKGETLWRIAHNYGVDVGALADANGLSSPREVYAGKRLFIPDPRKHHGSLAASVDRDAKAPVEKPHFIWPVAGEIASAFGSRNGERHDGIDIRAAEGTPVKAVDDGQVVYSSDRLRGYGNVIIIHHKDGFYTVYAHNKQNLVDAGKSVAKGETIATVGNTGNASGCHLHFEVRQGKNVVNPLFYLP